MQNDKSKYTEEIFITNIKFYCIKYCLMYTDINNFIDVILLVLIVDNNFYILSTGTHH